MNKAARLFAPYEGDQPFLYFCFSHADEKRILPLLQQLYARGCRVWYPSERVDTVALREHQNARMTKAQLLVLYQTKNAREDRAVKSAVLVCQAKDIPIISIDTDKEESTLSMGVDPRAVHLTAQGLNALEEALVHCEGFSQELLGTPQKVRHFRLMPLTLSVFAAAIALFGASFLYRQLPLFATETPAAEEQARPEDTVFFSDPALTQAVREALGGGLLTEESTQAVTMLRLNAMPERIEELLLLPNLTRIEIDQKIADSFQPLLERYEIVLRGGEP